MIKIMRNKNIIKDIFILAFPAIAEMALNTLVGVADTIMIGQFIGTEGLSAVGFANQIIFTLIFIFSSFNAGATAMVARSYGEKNYKKLNKIIGQNMTLNFIIGIIIYLVTLFYAKDILNILDISQEVHNMGSSYIRYVAISQLFMFISFAAAASLRGSGDTKTPMYITGIANILNIIGNYLLITGFSIFPEMGIAGAALSTSIARGIAAVLYLYVLIGGKEKIKLKTENLRVSFYILGPLWNFSYAAAIEQFFMQVAFFANGWIVALLSTTAEAAFRILITIESTSFMPAIGISIATATLVGKRLGEKDPEKSFITGQVAGMLGITWGIFMGILFFIFPEFFLSIFTDDMKVIDSAIFTMKLVGLNQPLLAFMIVMGGALRGTGDTKGVMWITSLRLWIIFVPFNYIFVKYFNTGVNGVWYAEILSFLIFTVVIYRRFAAREWANIEMF
ncbi:MAG: MATE family efflux transporter [Halanaerobiaceae bacterium]